MLGEQEHAHGDDARDQDPEENALVAGDHGWVPLGVVLGAGVLAGLAAGLVDVPGVEVGAWEGAGGGGSWRSGGWAAVCQKTRAEATAFGDALLVVGVADTAVVRAAGGELQDEGGAGEGVERADGSAAEDEGDLGAGERGAELALEGCWLCGTQAACALSQGTRAGSAGTGASSELYRWTPRRCAGGVEQEAGDGVGVVGDAGAVVERERRGRVPFPERWLRHRFRGSSRR